jgi:hypothetical protein
MRVGCSIQLFALNGMLRTQKPNKKSIIENNILYLLSI